MELWDLYYADETPSGLTFDRSLKIIPDGYFHIVVETLVKHVDGTYLVTQRSFDKKESPGVYEGSAGGSVLAGETKEAGAIREVLEETSLIITSVEPTYYFVRKDCGIINQGYLAITKSPKDSVKYQEGETINHKWLTLAELKEFIKSENYNQHHRRRLETYLDTIN